MRRTKLKSLIVWGFVIADMALLVPGILFGIHMLHSEEDARTAPVDRSGRLTREERSQTNRGEMPSHRAHVDLPPRSQLLLSPEEGRSHLPPNRTVPDLELTRVDGEGNVRIAELAKEKPTVLVFASFT
jgi:hypothetical protein